MREDQFLGILTLVWALGIPFDLEKLVQLWSIISGHVFDTIVHTESELFAALTQPNILQVSLANDVVSAHSFRLNRNLILNLNGHNLTTLCPMAPAIDIKYGNLIITGYGSIISYGEQSPALRVRGATTADNEKYAAVLIDHDIKIFAPNSYAIVVAPNFQAAYGVEVDFRGTIVAQNGFLVSAEVIERGQNAPLISIADHTKITVDENSGVAFHAAGYGKWQVGASEVAGAVGALVESGVLNFMNTCIVATGKSLLGGSVFRFVSSYFDYQTADITLSGGEYTSLHDYIFVINSPVEDSVLQNLIINNGKFAGKLGVLSGFSSHNTSDPILLIHGGQFTEDIENYLANNCHIERRRGQKIYTVVANAATEKLDADVRLARAKGRLQAMIENSQLYTQGYADGDLGEWRTGAAKALTTIKRAVTSAKKALNSKPDYERIINAENSLQHAFDDIEEISESMHTALAEAIASVEAIDPQDYTQYSYHQLLTAVTSAKQLITNSDSPLEELHSALLDLEINIDLLDGIDEVPDEEIENEPVLVSPNSTNDKNTSDSDCLIVPNENMVFMSSLLLTQSDIFLSPEPDLPTTPSVSPAATSANLAELEFDPTYILEHSVEYPAAAALLEAKENLYTMLEAVQELTVNDYETDYVEQFGELQVAIVKARTILYKTETNFVEIMSIMNELTQVTRGLKGAQIEAKLVPETESNAEPDAIIQPAVDWTALREVVSRISNLDATNYTTESYHQILIQLESAKNLFTTETTTQSAVDAAVFEINLALLMLEPLLASDDSSARLDIASNIHLSTRTIAA